MYLYVKTAVKEPIVKIKRLRLFKLYSSDKSRYIKSKYLFRLVQRGSNHSPFALDVKTARWSRRYNARTKSEGAVVQSPLNQFKCFFARILCQSPSSQKIVVCCMNQTTKGLLSCNSELGTLVKYSTLCMINQLTKKKNTLPLFNFFFLDFLKSRYFEIEPQIFFFGSSAQFGNLFVNMYFINK